MWRTMRAVLLAAVALSACSESGQAAGGDEYPPFSDVDPYTSEYFIALEGTGLVESQGEERLYNLGLNVCRRLDAGQSIQEQLADDAGLGDRMGAIVGAAVSDMCPQHGDAVEAHLDR